MAMVDSTCDELQNLVNECSQLKKECQSLQQTNSELEHECKILRQTNSIILQRQLEGEAKISQLQGENDSLKALLGKAEAKANYLEMVKKNQRWEYPLAVPSINEIMSDDIDVEDSENIHDDITAMKELTRSMRRGEFLEPIDPNNFGDVNHYYDGYLPHYKEFADALIEYRHAIEYMEEKTFRFRLGNTPLPKEVLDILQDALQQTHFHKLDFHINYLEGSGYISFIANCVNYNTRLKDLELNGITFEHTRDVEELCEAINTKCSMEALQLTDCESEEGVSLVEIFNKLKSKSLQKINLNDNAGDWRPADMLEFLSSNPSLRELGFRQYIHIFNEQIIVNISDALRHNATLRKLRLLWVHNTLNNCHLLESVIFNRTSLNAIYDSNHHCNIVLFGRGDIPSDIHKFNTYRDPILNRRQKIYNILSNRNRRRENAALFESNGIGVKHVPQILALLKPLSEHSLRSQLKDMVNNIPDKDEVLPLSIAYEIMRDWKMPELYSLDSVDEH